MTGNIVYYHITRYITRYIKIVSFYDFSNYFSAISGIIDDIQKHFGIGPSQTSLLRTRIGELRLI